MGKKNKEVAEFYTNEYVMDEAEFEQDRHVKIEGSIVEPPNPNAWTSFILGITSSLAWLAPIIGLPITIVGIVLGAVSMKRKKSRGIGIAGFVINIVFLCCSIAKGVVDIVFYFKNKND